MREDTKLWRRVFENHCKKKDFTIDSRSNKQMDFGLNELLFLNNIKLPFFETVYLVYKIGYILL